MARFSRINRSAASISAVAAATLALAAPALAQDSFKLGVVTFLSGPAADSFGVPARNGGQFVIDQLNKGAGPAPYDKVGFGGLKIEPVIIDENGGATKQVQELRNLYGARQCRRRTGLYRFRRLSRRGADRRRAEEDARADGLRHAAHLRGGEIQLRLPHRGPCHDG